MLKQKIRFKYFQLPLISEQSIIINEKARANNNLINHFPRSGIPVSPIAFAASTFRKISQ
jgi:hypothetical protein